MTRTFAIGLLLLLACPALAQTAQGRAQTVLDQFATGTRKQAPKPTTTRFRLRLDGEWVGDAEVSTAWQDSEWTASWATTTQLPNSSSVTESSGTSRLGPQLHLIHASVRLTSRTLPEPGEDPEDVFPPLVRVTEIAQTADGWSLSTRTPPDGDTVMVGPGAEPLRAAVEGKVHGSGFAEAVLLARAFAAAKPAAYELTEVDWAQDPPAAGLLAIQVEATQARGVRVVIGTQAKTTFVFNAKLELREIHPPSGIQFVAIEGE